MLTENRVPLDELSLPEDIASELSGDEPTPFTDDVPVTISDLEDVPVTELIVPTTGEIESIEVTTPNGTTITVCYLSLIRMPKNYFSPVKLPTNFTTHLRLHLCYVRI